MTDQQAAKAALLEASRQALSEVGELVCRVDDVASKLRPRNPTIRPHCEPTSSGSKPTSAPRSSASRKGSTPSASR